MPTSIEAVAAEFDLSVDSVKQLVDSCPLDNSPEADGFDLNELVELLAELGGDVEATAAMAHRMKAEFGFIPSDSSCVSEGGAQVMYHAIRYGENED